MTRYRFDGFTETILTGLAHGVNATVTRPAQDNDDETDQVEPAEGSTVVVQPGDEVETLEPYPHAHMVNLETGASDVPVTEAEPDVDAAPAKKARARRAPTSNGQENPR